MTLDDARRNPDRRVVYKSHPGSKILEYGRIARCGPEVVFIRFDGHSSALAVKPEDIEFTPGR